MQVKKQQQGPDREQWKWKSLSCVWLFVTPRTIEAMEFSRPEYWSGYPFHLQGIFPTQGSNSGLLHYRWNLYQLSHMGSSRILEWLAYPSSSGSFQARNWTRFSCIAGGFFFFNINLFILIGGWLLYNIALVLPYINMNPPRGYTCSPSWMQVDSLPTELSGKTWNNGLVPNWKGVCQGCILSPCLFNLFAKYIIQNAGLDKAQAGIKIAGRNAGNLRYADDTNGRKWRGTKEPLDESERGEWKSWLKAQHSKNEDHGIWSHHFMAKDGETVTDLKVRLYQPKVWSWAPKSLWMVTAAMKLRDTCSLEEKPWWT